MGQDSINDGSLPVARVRPGVAVPQQQLAQEVAVEDEIPLYTPAVLLGLCFGVERVNTKT